MPPEHCSSCKCRFRTAGFVQQVQSVQAALAGASHTVTRDSWCTLKSWHCTLKPRMLRNWHGTTFMLDAGVELNGEGRGGGPPPAVAVRLMSRQLRQLKQLPTEPQHGNMQLSMHDSALTIVDAASCHVRIHCLTCRGTARLLPQSK